MCGIILCDGKSFFETKEVKEKNYATIVDGFSFVMLIIFWRVMSARHVWKYGTQFFFYIVLSREPWGGLPTTLFYFIDSSSIHRYEFPKKGIFFFLLLPTNQLFLESLNEFIMMSKKTFFHRIYKTVLQSLLKVKSLTIGASLSMQRETTLERWIYL